MPSQITIKLKCEKYLVKFLETMHGPSPISFPKNSNFNTMLDVFLDKPPLDWKEPDFDENCLEIRLPFFEDKNVLYNNYLTVLKQEIFIKNLKKYFKITFRGEISKYVVMGLDRQDSIDLFIDKYNLSQDNRDMLEKDFQRYLKIRSNKRLFRTKIISSVKDPICPEVS